MPQPPPSPLFPYTTLFRSDAHGKLEDVRVHLRAHGTHERGLTRHTRLVPHLAEARLAPRDLRGGRPDRHLDVRRVDWGRDRKSTRLNSSHVEISYAVFCLK